MRKWVERGTGTWGWGCPVQVEVFCVHSTGRRDYPREMCLAWRRELGEGRDHALVRYGSGNMSVVQKNMPRQLMPLKVQHIGQNPGSQGTCSLRRPRKVILPASAPKKMCLKEGDLGPALREEGGT